MTDTERIDLNNDYCDIFERKASEQIELALSKKGIASIEVINEHLNIAQGLKWAAYYMKFNEFPYIH